MQPFPQDVLKYDDWNDIEGVATRNLRQFVLKISSHTLQEEYSVLTEPKIVLLWFSLGSYSSV